MTPRNAAKQAGVRPSSGAATPEMADGVQFVASDRALYDAAPEDGRTPGRLHIR